MAIHDDGIINLEREANMNSLGEALSGVLDNILEELDNEEANHGGRQRVAPLQVQEHGANG